MIVLLEFDMNAQFGLALGRPLMHQAMDAGVFEHVPQFGRTQQSYQSALVLKRVTWDIARQYKRPLAALNNDLAKCYDSIHPSFCLMCARRAGANRQILNLRAQIQGGMRFFVRTGFGVSPNGFGNYRALEHNAAPPCWYSFGHLE